MFELNTLIDILTLYAKTTSRNRGTKQNHVEWWICNPRSLSYFQSPTANQWNNMSQYETNCEIELSINGIFWNIFIFNDIWPKPYTMRWIWIKNQYLILRSTIFIIANYKILHVRFRIKFDRMLSTNWPKRLPRIKKTQARNQIFHRSGKRTQYSFQRFGRKQKGDEIQAKLYCYRDQWKDTIQSWWCNNKISIILMKILMGALKSRFYTYGKPT